MQDEHQPVSYSTPDDLGHLADLSKRLALAIRQAAADLESLWPTACVEIATAIERLRNPRWLAFDDVARQLCGTFGFDRLAGIETVYKSHDAFLRQCGWEVICEWTNRMLIHWWRRFG